MAVDRLVGLFLLRQSSGFCSELRLRQCRKRMQGTEDGVGILGGALFGVVQADFTLRRYIQTSIESLYLRDILSGLIKSVMFGIGITAVGCLEGLSTGGGAEQVGRSTTRSVVISILLVVVVDLVFTGVFFFLGSG